MTAVYVKIRATALLRRKAAGSFATGTERTGARLRVRCRARYLVVKRSGPSPAEPAAMWWGASSEETVIRASVEVCSIKLSRRPRATKEATTMVPFSVSLPPLSEIAQ
jgi:hypothetical protein